MCKTPMPRAALCPTLRSPRPSRTRRLHRSAGRGSSCEQRAWGVALCTAETVRRRYGCSVHTCEHDHASRRYIGRICVPSALPKKVTFEGHRSRGRFTQKCTFEGRRSRAPLEHNACACALLFVDFSARVSVAVPRRLTRLFNLSGLWPDKLK